MMWRIFRLELRVAFRHSAEIANPLWFFLIVITLFPLSIGPEPQLLARIAPGVRKIVGRRRMQLRTAPDQRGHHGGSQRGSSA